VMGGMADKDNFRYVEVASPRGGVFRRNVGEVRKAKYLASSAAWLCNGMSRTM